MTEGKIQVMLSCYVIEDHNIKTWNIMQGMCFWEGDDSDSTHCSVWWRQEKTYIHFLSSMRQSLNHLHLIIIVYRLLGLDIDSSDIFLQYFIITLVVLRLSALCNVRGVMFTPRDNLVVQESKVRES